MTVIDRLPGSGRKDKDNQDDENDNKKKERKKRKEKKSERKPEDGRQKTEDMMILSVLCSVSYSLRCVPESEPESLSLEADSISRPRRLPACLNVPRSFVPRSPTSSSFFFFFFFLFTSPIPPVYRFFLFFSLLLFFFSFFIVSPPPLSGSILPLFSVHLVSSRAVITLISLGYPRPLSLSLSFLLQGPN
ncbi:hypothetical protein BO70DRAFT_164902 [Aspergillus heteromorphus CBS 117.55]|uniref:Uncharacterized protein n=1 Tax=Aspergillus heteromorphus CBS 117.55 TaxID=1448321 RepID=A0A317WS59_9EURO|nr:uncharacterized protein BO70DRAFT_164902 [Aspergillus heteromorphus CBS 117.55]PWY89293.1 hypothetical protein BO70DRAFT_164902 [Aspergillus heteromorphus CBS 117.55]